MSFFLGFTLTITSLVIQLTLLPSFDWGLIALTGLLHFDQAAVALALIFFFSLGLAGVTLVSPLLVGAALTAAFLTGFFLKKFLLRRNLLGWPILFLIVKTIFYYLTGLGFFSLFNLIAQVLLVYFLLVLARKYLVDEKLFSGRLA